MMGLYKEGSIRGKGKGSTRIELSGKDEKGGRYGVSILVALLSFVVDVFVFLYVNY